LRELKKIWLKPSLARKGIKDLKIVENLFIDMLQAVKSVEKLGKVE
jgi:hypothetical protein